MKRNALVITASLIVLLTLVAFNVAADDGLPENIFKIDTGQTCVIFPDGSGECYCECEVGCEKVSVTNTPTTPVDPSPTVIDTPHGTPTEYIEATPLFCHCELGGGNDQDGPKNCNPTKYNNGHAKHEFDYFASPGETCTGWHK